MSYVAGASNCFPKAKRSGALIHWRIFFKLFVFCVVIKLSELNHEVHEAHEGKIQTPFVAVYMPSRIKKKE